MDSKDTTPVTSYEVGTKIIISAISMDEALAEMMKEEVKKIKKCLNDITLEELSSINTLLKNTITAMIITSDKIEAGIDLLKK